MKPCITVLVFLGFSLTVAAQKNDSKNAVPGTSYSSGAKIISLGIGFPNLHRIRYETPAGYTHLKTTGFGPVYARFEYAAFDKVGLVASLSYSTFHYAYYGYSPSVIHYDDANTATFSLSGNYHFTRWITNPHLDTYAGVGLSVDYQRQVFGNIPPYKSPETKAYLHPVLRAGARYYLDPGFGLFGEAGYDGLSVVQLGFSVRL